MATTISQVTDERDGSVISCPVAASTKILQGTIVCRNAAGNAVPGSDTASLVVLGIAAEEIDNSAGAAGDLSVQIYRKRAFFLLNDGLTIANVMTAGAAVIKDNNTVTTAAIATNDIPVGRVIEVTSAGVWVEIA